jgi:hypothetical protein
MLKQYTIQVHSRSAEYIWVEVGLTLIILTPSVKTVASIAFKTNEPELGGDFYRESPNSNQFVYFNRLWPPLHAVGLMNCLLTIFIII